MTTEELKLILDTINSIAGGATDLALVWIVLHYVLNFLEVPIVVAIVGLIAYKVAILIAAADEWSRLGKSVSSAYGEDGETFVYERHRRAVQKAIDAAKERK